jgi:hypothetical protein
MLPHLMLLRCTTTIHNNHTETAPQTEAMLLSQRPLETETERSLPSPNLSQTLSSHCCNWLCVLECRNISTLESCSLKSRISHYRKALKKLQVHPCAHTHSALQPKIIPSLCLDAPLSTPAILLQRARHHPLLCPPTFHVHPTW